MIKQLSFFEDASQKVSKKQRIVEMFVDGAARGNPGPAGAGVVIRHDSLILGSFGYDLGIKTNNQAEYCALLIGLFHLQEFSHLFDLVRINADSELLVKQIRGEYRVVHPELKRLWECVKKTLNEYSFEIHHIPRELNKEADHLANKGIDKKIQLPELLRDVCSCSN
jgi:ribonuclease HI